MRAGDLAVRPLHILHVVIALEPGGMEGVLVRVATALASRGFQIDVCCLAESGSLAVQLPSSSRLFVLGKPPGKSFGTLRRLRSVIRESQPDVLHTHNLGPLIYGAVASSLGLRCPVLHGEHGKFRERERTWGRLALRRWLYRCCGGVHTVSEHHRRQLVGMGMPSARLRAIVNGVDTERFQPGDKAAARAILGLPETGKIVGVVGRLQPEKRHVLLLEAMAGCLVTAGPEFRLLMVGDGAERGSLATLTSQLGLGGHVVFAGFQSDVVPYYQAMDLLAVPSEREGMSNAVLEAMACGVPVLASETSGCAEVITSGREGRIAPMASAGEVEQALRMALGDARAFAALGVAARRKVLDSFRFSTTVNRYAMAYHDIAHRCFSALPDNDGQESGPASEA